MAGGHERAMRRSVSGLLTPASRSATAVGEDLDLLERDQPIADHLVELGQDGADAVLLVDDLDQDRQVLRETQQPGRVEVRVGAEALDAADDGRAGQLPLAQERDDRLVERLAIVVVRLADVDPDEQRRTLDAQQTARPIARPAATATRPMTMDPARLAIAGPYEPLSTRPQDSSM